MAKYFHLGKYYKLVLLVLVMSCWMFSFGYQYIFLNEQGDLPDNKFDKNKFYLIFGLLILGQVFSQFGRAMIVYNFALEVSGKLNSLSKLIYNKNINKNCFNKKLLIVYYMDQLINSFTKIQLEKF